MIMLIPGSNTAPRPGTPISIMIVLNDILYLDLFDLVEVYGMSDSSVKSSLNRSRSSNSKSWKSIQNPEDGRAVLIEYRTIPKGTIRKYRIPSEDELRKDLSASDEDMASEALLRLVNSQIKPSDTEAYLTAGVAIRDARSYATAAAWLGLLSENNCKTRVKGLWLPGIESNTELLKLTIETLQNMEKKPKGLHKVRSIQVLRRKMVKWRKAGPIREKQLMTLVHKHTRILDRRGGQNSRKVSQEVEEAILAAFIGMKGSDVKLNIQQVHNRYQDWVEAGKITFDDTKDTGYIILNPPQISVTTIKNIILRPENQKLIELHRNGRKNYSDKAGMILRRRSPNYGLSMVTCDGETSPFSMRPKSGSKAQNRPVAYLIFDMMSQAIVGFALGENENLDLMKRAFYDMIIRMEGRLPLEAQMDNFGKGYQKQLELIIPQITFPAPGNAKAKPAESFIGQFEQQVLRTARGNVGQNITTTTDQSSRNNDIPLDTFTFEEIKELYLTAVEEWNGSISSSRGKGRTREENLRRKINPECPILDKTLMTLMFGKETTATINGGNIILTYQREKQFYVIPNYHKNLAKLPQHEHVRVRFMPHDPSIASIYEIMEKGNPKADRYIMDIAPAPRPSIAKAERTKEDREAVNQHLKDSREMLEALEKKREELSDPVFVNPGLTAAKAEEILNRGYTNKDDMKEAEEALLGENTTYKANPRWTS